MTGSEAHSGKGARDKGAGDRGAGDRGAGDRGAGDRGTGDRDETDAETGRRRTGQGFQSVFFSAPDGLKLHARDYGRENSATRERLPLVCLPGLSRNARDFHDLAMLLSSAPLSPRRIVSFDYRGRGGSQWDRDPTHYTVMVEAEDVLAGMAALGIEQAIFLGTSRGGLIMHVLAATHPTIMAAGILNDIGPVIETAGLARIKAYLFRTPGPRNWDEAAAIQKQVHGREFPALGESDWLDLAHAILTEKDGQLVADYDPHLLDELKDMDLDAPLPTLWPQFDNLATNPLLVIRGENSALLSEETLAEMKARAPSIRTHLALGQGHAPILHRGELPDVIGAFLNTADTPRV